MSSSSMAYVRLRAAIAAASRSSRLYWLTGRVPAPPPRMCDRRSEANERVSPESGRPRATSCDASAPGLDASCLWDEGSGFRGWEMRHRGRGRRRGTVGEEADVSATGGEDAPNPTTYDARFPSANPSKAWS